MGQRVLLGFRVFLDSWGHFRFGPEASQFCLILSWPFAYIPVILQLLRLVAEVLYKSPAHNDFIYMAEHRLMDQGIVQFVEGMSYRFASPAACAEFQVNTFTDSGALVDLKQPVFLRNLLARYA